VCASRYEYNCGLIAVLIGSLFTTHASPAALLRCRFGGLWVLLLLLALVAVSAAVLAAGSAALLLSLAAAAATWLLQLLEPCK
jgi:hypothetical protein